LSLQKTAPIDGASRLFSLDDPDLPALTHDCDRDITQTQAKPTLATQLIMKAKEYLVAYLGHEDGIRGSIVRPIHDDVSLGGVWFNLAPTEHWSGERDLQFSAREHRQPHHYMLGQWVIRNQRRKATVGGHVLETTQRAKAAN
jgi:hypothetical protein